LHGRSPVSMELVFQRHDTPNEDAPTTPSVICGEAALCHQLPLISLWPE
jgi:hypothetical protein